MGGCNWGGSFRVPSHVYSSYRCCDTYRHKDLARHLNYYWCRPCPAETKQVWLHLIMSPALRLSLSSTQVAGHQGDGTHCACVSNWCGGHADIRFNGESQDIHAIGSCEALGHPQHQQGVIHRNGRRHLPAARSITTC